MQAGSDFKLSLIHICTTEEEVTALLERFELDDKQDKLGNELSKGMMQKVSICCALVIKPKVILLDEPMVGLDPRAIKELKEVILELRDQGATVLISTHMLEMVEELWDAVSYTHLDVYKRQQLSCSEDKSVPDGKYEIWNWSLTDTGDEVGEE